MYYLSWNVHNFIVSILILLVSHKRVLTFSMFELNFKIKIMVQGTAPGEGYISYMGKKKFCVWTVVVEIEMATAVALDTSQLWVAHRVRSQAGSRV